MPDLDLTELNVIIQGKLDSVGIHRINGNVPQRRQRPQLRRQRPQLRPQRPQLNRDLSSYYSGVQDHCHRDSDVLYHLTQLQFRFMTGQGPHDL